MSWVGRGPEDGRGHQDDHNEIGVVDGDEVQGRQEGAYSMGQLSGLGVLVDEACPPAQFPPSLSSSSRARHGANSEKSLRGGSRGVRSAVRNRVRSITGSVRFSRVGGSWLQEAAGRGDTITAEAFGARPDEFKEHCAPASRSRCPEETMAFREDGCRSMTACRRVARLSVSRS